MDEHTGQFLKPGEELRADNELLKLKLELEHGMVLSDTESLSAAIENKWLRHIYEFERLHKQAARIKVYDFVKQPYFVRVEALERREIPAALEHLIACMRKHSLSFEYDTKQDPEEIYRFITEEFFELEIDDISMEGLVQYFSYDEFHPKD